MQFKKSENIFSSKNQLSIFRFLVGKFHIGNLLLETTVAVAFLLGLYLFGLDDGDLADGLVEAGLEVLGNLRRGKPNGKGFCFGLLVWNFKI
jgi:hypothetical protein